MVNAILGLPAKTMLLWARVRDKAFTLLLRGAFRTCGRLTTFVPPFRYGGTRHISIGEHVYIGAGSWVAARAGLDAEASDEIIVIGDGVSMAGACSVLGVRKVTIERNVLMARNVYIADHSHKFSDMSVAVADQGIDQVKPVVVREGAWLGQNVVVCPGVTIGRNAVVGANSVVRHDVPDYAVVAGAPARLIRIIGTERASN